MNNLFYDRYGKIHYPEEGQAFSRSGVFAIILKQGQVLLTAEPHTGVYEFPGGGIERGEDMRRCLMRELYEETGYDFELGEQETKVRLEQTVNYYSDSVRPGGLYLIYHQTFLVYDAEKYGFELREGEWKTPENGRAVWAEIKDLYQGKIPFHYAHAQALEKFRRLS